MQELKSEDNLQTKCYVWFHNSYPDLRGLLCYNLNNSKNKIDGARNKAMGLQAGRSDLTFYYKSKAYFIEMKTETGRQSQSQKSWQNIVESQGFRYYIVRNEMDFKKIIKNIIQ